ARYRPDRRRPRPRPLGVLRPSARCAVESQRTGSSMKERAMAADQSRDGAYGEKLAAVMAASGFRWEAIDPEWQALFQAYVGDGMYRRDVLDAKTRELCAVAALVVLDRQRALRKHLLA